MNKHIFAIPSQPRSDYILNPEKSFFSLIQAEESVNLVFDPEILAYASGVDSGYEAVGAATLTPQSAVQRRGVYSLQVTNIGAAGHGIRYDAPLAPTAGQAYTFSVDHKGTGRYVCNIIDRIALITLATVEFEGQTFWTRQSVTAVALSTNLLGLEVFASANGFNVPEFIGGFYVDGFQLEPKAYDTTFISGDTPGFPYELPNPYGWLGTPHNSASFRLGSTRSGGRVVPFDKAGLQVLEFSGLGMPDPEHSLTDFSMQNGALYDCTRIPPREFSIVGQFCGAEPKDWLCNRLKVVNAINPMKGLSRLQFQLLDGDTPLSEVFDLDALYQSGMDLNFNSHFGERASISFTMPDPLLHSNGYTGAELQLVAETPEDSGILVRGLAGNWDILTGIAATTWTDVIIGPDGLLYGLRSLGTIAPETYVLSRWDGANWFNIPGDIEGRAMRMAAAPNNKIYIVGSITEIIGEALAVDSIVAFNVLTDTWENLQTTTVTGIQPKLQSVAYHKAGYILVGGVFTAIDNTNGAPVTGSPNIAAYHLATGTWVAAGDGVNGAVHSIAVSNEGVIFIGGRFGSGPGTPTNLAKSLSPINDFTLVDTPTWAGDQTDAAVYALAFGPNSRLYIGGRFNDSVNTDYTTLLPPGDHSPLTNIAYLDATSAASNSATAVLRPVGRGTEDQYTLGVDTHFSAIRDIAVSCDGEVFVVGDFRQVFNGPTYIPEMVIDSPYLARFGPDLQWRAPEVILDPTGSTFIGEDFIGLNAVEFGQNCQRQGSLATLGFGVAGTGSLIDVPPGYSGTLFVGYSDNPAVEPNPLLPGQTTINIGCAIDVRPVIRIIGPGSLHMISNYSTGSELGFRPLTVQAGEIVTIDLESPLVRIYSSVQANVANYLSDTIQLSLFRLQSGINHIQVVMQGTTEDSRILMTWRNRYVSIDAACVSECASGS